MIIKGTVDIVCINKKNKPGYIGMRDNVYYTWKKELLEEIYPNDFIVLAFHLQERGEKINSIIDDISVIQAAPRKIDMEPERVPLSALLFTIERIERDIKFVEKYINKIEV